MESSYQEHLKHTHISVGQGLCYCLRLWTVESVQSFIHVNVPACLNFSVLMEYMFQKKKLFYCYLRQCFLSSLIIDHTRISQSLTLREEYLRPKAVLMSDCVSMCSFETCIYFSSQITNSTPRMSLARNKNVQLLNNKNPYNDNPLTHNQALRFFKCLQWQ